MPATDLETLVVSFEATTSKFDKSVQKLNRDFARQMGTLEKRAKQSQTSINSSLAKIGKGVTGFAKGTAGGALAGLVAGFSVEGVTKAVAALAEIGDVADRVGMTTDAIQELRYAVEQTGGTAADADTAIQFFAKQWGTAGSAVRKAFENAGVAMKDSEGNVLSVAEAFEKFLDIIKNAGSAQNQLALSAAGFSKGAGGQMVLLAKGGAAAFHEFGDAAHRAGLITKSEVIAPMRELDDKITELRASIERLGTELIANFAGPALKSAMESFLGYLKLIAYWADLLDEAVKTLNFQPILDAFTPGTLQNVRTRLAIGGSPISPTRTAQDIPAGMTAGAVKKGAAGGGPGPVDLGGASKTETAYQRETEAIQDKIAAMQTERATLGLAAGPTAEFQARQELIAAATEKGATLTALQTAEINKLAQAAGIAATALESAKAKLDAMNEAQKAFASEMSGAFEGLIVDGKTLNETFADILDNLARMLIQAAIAGTGPLAGLLGTAAAPGTGGAGGLAGILAGAMAGGGSISRGRAYLVGEKGPEIIVPKVAGQVISNDKLRAAGGAGGGVVLNMPVNISAPGADPAQLMRVAAELSALRADVPRQVRAGFATIQGRRQRV